MEDLPNMIKAAKEFSYERKLKFPKKMTSEVFRTEVEHAHILGECSSYERIISYIRMHPDISREDLEAAIHLNLEQSLGAAALYYQGRKLFGLEKILETHGYYPENKEKEKIDECSG